MQFVFGSKPVKTGLILLFIIYYHLLRNLASFWRLNFISDFNTLIARNIGASDLYNVYTYIILLFWYFYNFNILYYLLGIFGATDAYPFRTRNIHWCNRCTQFRWFKIFGAIAEHRNCLSNPVFRVFLHGIFGAIAASF